MILSPIKKYRLLEMIPGIMIWGTFVLAILLSLFEPVWVIAFILAFSFFWLLRVSYFVYFIIIGYFQYKKSISTDWKTALKSFKKLEELYHLIILPTYAEPFEVVDSSLESYKNADFDNKKIIIVLSGEERAKENFEKVSQRIYEKYKDTFLHLEITMHPDGILGEMKSKGANSHWAGHTAKKLIDKMNIKYENVIVSYFDIDTVVHKQYFAALTYKYLTHPNPTRSAYQPIVLYHNNIWEAPMVARIAAFNTTFWLMTDLARPDRLFTFSSHAMSLKALVEVGFWQRDIVTDDSRIFLQCFIHYQGDFEVTPMNIPIYMDTVQAESYWKSFKNLYKQQRRWAYSVEHFPYMYWHFFNRKNNIPLNKKLKYFINIAEGLYSWATVPIILLFLGRLPFWLASEPIKSTALAQHTPYILEFILILSMIGIVISAFFSIALLPPRPQEQPRHKFLLMLLQWVLLPVTLIIWGSIPATEAQTRLMLGKYLGFWVTEKVRK